MSNRTNKFSPIGKVKYIEQNSGWGDTIKHSHKIAINLYIYYLESNFRIVEKEPHYQEQYLPGYFYTQVLKNGSHLSNSCQAPTDKKSNLYLKVYVYLKIAWDEMCYF